jgi:hypothetical protein
MKKMFLLVFVLFIISCSSFNVNIVSPDRLPPYQGSVDVYFAKNNCTDTESQLPAHYTIIAELNYSNWGKNIKIEDIVSLFKAQAQQTGANAIIIDSCSTSGGKNAKARAILIKQINI